MPVEGSRDVLPKPLSHRHPGGRGQLMAIESACAARARAPAGIQGSVRTSIYITIIGSLSLFCEERVFPVTDKTQNLF